MAKGPFPQRFSWLIDNPLRRLLLTPGQLAGRLPLTEGSAVLELGPGSGYFSAELARRVPRGRLELVDLQPGMLRKARRKLMAKGLHNVGYTAHDASAGLPFRERSFDVAVLVAVLGEVSAIENCLRDLRRVLRSGGVLAIHEQTPDPDRIDIRTLRDWVTSQGFTFQQRWGPSWNYTALFERPRS